MKKRTYLVDLHQSLGGQSCQSKGVQTLPLWQGRESQESLSEGIKGAEDSQIIGFVPKGTLLYPLGFIFINGIYVAG